MNLRNKKILFVSHPLMGYHKIIEAELKRRGARVKWVSQTNPSVFEKIRVEFYPQKGWQSLQDYWHRVVASFSADYDMVLIVNAGSMPYDVVLALRSSIPNAAFISYNWDDFECIGDNMQKSLGLFDRALTYNIIEAKQYGIIPRPFFYDAKTLTNPNRGG